MTKKEANAWCRMMQRMLSKEEMIARYPDARPRYWCQARYPLQTKFYAYPKVHCTRAKDHDGPHVDYLVENKKGKPVPFLVWFGDK